MEANFGGVLGMESDTASLASNTSIADSMRGQYPRSELEARATPISFGSGVPPQLPAQAGQGGNPDTIQSRFHENFSDPDLPRTGEA